MRFIARSCAAIGAGLAMLAGGLTSAIAQAVPSAEDFARLPTLSRISLSPDGTRMAALLNVDNSYQLGIFEVGGDALNATYLMSGTEKLNLRDLAWASDERIVFSVGFADYRYRTQTTETRLLSMKADGSDQFWLFEKASEYDVAQLQDDIVSLLPDDERYILVQYGVPSAVYRVNIENSRRHRVVQTARDNIDHWIADADGTIRIGRGIVDNETRRIILRDEDGNWHDVSHRAADPAVTFRVVGVSDRANIFYVLTSAGGDADALYEYDLSTDSPGEMLFRHPTSDVFGIYQDSRTGRALGVYFAEDEAEMSWLEETPVSATLDVLQEQFPDNRVRITSLNRDEDHMVIKLDNATRPGNYALYDVESRHTMRLPAQYPALADAALGTVIPTSYEARDGLTIPAYVTLPPGLSSLEEARGLPFVILPHGGPTARDLLTFDYWAQFLATRGYGVLQMNFRGSAGYGVEFRTAGNRQWGQAMQDDITDGARWLVANDHADEGRLAIMGGSYGGYAALMGTVRTPDLYQCAVSFAGVSDLVDIVRDARDYVNGRYMTRHIGRLWGDRQMLVENSPINRVDDITVPVLLLHGDNDRAVDVNQSRRLAGRMGDAGVPVTYLEFENGDHHLSLYANRLRFLQETAAFLDGCIG